MGKVPDSEYDKTFNQKWAIDSNFRNTMTFKYRRKEVAREAIRTEGLPEEKLDAEKGSGKRNKA